MTQFKAALVGLGFGAEFIPIYQRHPDAEMFAICQRSQDKLDQVGNAFGVERRYTDANDEWQSSKSFGRDELLVLAKAADLANSRVYELQSADRERSRASAAATEGATR